MKCLVLVLLLSCTAVVMASYRIKPKGGCAPQKVTHGVVTSLLAKGKRMYVPGKTIGVRCHKGYVHVGSPTATCTAKGIWTSILQCSPKFKKAKICKMTELKLGYYRPHKKAYGPHDVITWYCNANHYLKGPHKSKCTPNGYFAPHKPTCIPSGGGDGDIKPYVHKGPGSYILSKHACAVPHPPKNGYIAKVKPGKYRYINVGKEIKFGCNKGFRLDGSERSVCERGRGFNQPPPDCLRVQCEFQPLKPRYGNYVDLKTEYYYGDKIEYVCEKNYLMHGIGWAVCQDNGQFSSGPPECREPSCTHDCKLVPGRTCQCDKKCVIRHDCCGNFDQLCRKLFY